MMIGIYNQRNPDTAQKEWLNEDIEYQDIYQSIFGDEEDKASFLESIYGVESKLATEKFIEKLQREQIQFLQAHELRKMVYQKIKQTQ